jgi:translation initiation factor eIF-2B subunit delta
MTDDSYGQLSVYFRRATIPLIVTVALAVTLHFKFNMPASDPATSPAGTENAPAGSIASKNETNTKGMAQSTKTSATADPVLAPKLSGAELKAQKKAEKAARRQQEKSGPVASTPASGGKSQAQNAQSQRGKGEPGGGQHRRTGSTAADMRNGPIKGAQAATTQPEEPRKEDKTVELFRHLYKARATTISGASKEVHPAVLALGQQMSSYIICGSNARLVATLQAFKRVSFQGSPSLSGDVLFVSFNLQISLCPEY